MYLITISALIFNLCRLISVISLNLAVRATKAIQDNHFVRVKRLITRTNEFPHQFFRIERLSFPDSFSLTRATQHSHSTFPYLGFKRSNAGLSWKTGIKTPYSLFPHGISLLPFTDSWINAHSSSATASSIPQHLIHEVFFERLRQYLQDLKCECVEVRRVLPFGRILLIILLFLLFGRSFDNTVSSLCVRLRTHVT